jgi:hypothetical protein
MPISSCYSVLPAPRCGCRKYSIVLFNPVTVAPAVISAHGDPSAVYPINNAQATHGQYHPKRKWDYAGNRPVSAMNILTGAL